MLDAFFQRMWYEGEHRWLSLVLLPLSWLFSALAAMRRAFYRAGVFRSLRVARPVIVIGNITVGGAGKTPLTIWLARRLAARGVRVGIILRGYGGASATWPRDVAHDSSPAEAGDEAVLLASRTGAIVVAGPDRVAAAERAIARGAEVVLSDDGLQHYRLGRDCEIAVLDEQRVLGNRRLLPAGPLREPGSRLATADAVVMTRRPGAAPVESEPPTVGARLVAVARLGDAVSLVSGETRPLRQFRGRAVHALAAIGNPEAFFRALAVEGLDVRPHPFPDHAAPTSSDLRFGDDAPVLMTEKDAVKCRRLADARLWSVPMLIEMSEADAAVIDAIVARVLAPDSTAP